MISYGNMNIESMHVTMCLDLVTYDDFNNICCFEPTECIIVLYMNIRDINL